MIDIRKCKKERIVKEIEKSGCQMLKDKLDGTETKEEIIKYLKKCKCPKLHQIFTGID